MTRQSNITAVAALGFCMLVCSLSWMYMRMPQYRIMVETGSDITSWLLSGYIIAEVSTVIVAGTIIDRLGPKNAVLIGTSLFSGASIGLVMCESVEMMIAFRVIQGCGAGFLFTVALAFIPKVYPKSKRLDPHKVMTLAFSLGSLFGTAVGYYFTFDAGNWKYLIPVNALVVIICGTLAYRALPEMPREYVRDAPGLMMTIITIAAVMVYTQMVNDSFDLVSYESLAFAELCIILIFVLVRVEKRAKDPIIPHGITRNDFGLMAGMFLAGFCGLGMLQFITMFMMVSYGASMYTASEMLICLIMGGVVTSLMGMKMVYKEGIRPLLLTGSIVIAIAFLGAYFLMPRGMAGVGFSLFAMGLGFGLIITEMLVSLQAVTPVRNQGAVTGMLMSCRFIGIILGMAVYKAIVHNALDDYIQKAEGEIISNLDMLLFTNYSGYLNDLVLLFESTVRDCCVAAGIAVLSVLVICWFMVGRSDKDAPEFVDDESLRCSISPETPSYG